MGIINRGDSFRRRRSRSNSLAPVSPIHQRAGTAENNASDANTFANHQQVEIFRVQMLGSSGVGKQALVSQFRTSDCINAYDGPECDESEQNISIILNGVESELNFAIGSYDMRVIDLGNIDRKSNICNN
ncbi:uncharacterized protein LOC119674721 [Teleopsis dalmanni]|uniref:uncharacterized protein LOC119674721 n=1 Tax=Teleopsis dalmanni TaxID=139649 RepID=UPI0018CCF5AA|nr:uncharacterized protein LOC119674721 [Teleopsis dalmanni]